MQRTIDASELRRSFDELLNEVARNDAEYVVAREGQPQAVLVSYDELARLRRIEERERNFVERWGTMRERMAALSDDFSEEDVAADIEAARQEVWEARGGTRR